MNVLRETSIVLENGSYPHNIFLGGENKFSIPRLVKTSPTIELLLMKGQNGRPSRSAEAKVRIISTEYDEDSAQTLFTYRVEALLVPACCTEPTSQRAHPINYAAQIAQQLSYRL